MGKKVLIAPLNWGLGHASRCIPIIQALIKKNYQPILASDGEALDLLKKEFPELPNHELQSYGIRYPFKNAILNMVRNMPSFFRAIWLENKELKKIVAKENIEIILSDNRYGIFHPTIKSIYIGHQVNLKAGNTLLSMLATRLNKLMIRRFDELWIPDFENERSLAGDLSKTITKIPCKFIGPLSRFKKMEVDLDYEICAVISGPEPQKSGFTKLLIDHLEGLSANKLIILGKMDEDKDFMLNPTTRVISHATSKRLNDLINRSKVVIARAGYSTIMDLTVLNKKAILIPTPGQTEQEYLARHLKVSSGFVFQHQMNLDILSGIKELSYHKKEGNKIEEFDVESYL